MKSRLNRSQLLLSFKNSVKEILIIERFALLFYGDTYLIPTKTFLLLKRFKKIDMTEGIVTIDYTHLVWMNLKGISEEIYDKLSGDEPIKYRIYQVD